MNPTPPVPSWNAIKTIQPLYIPTLDGKAVAETLQLEVPAWQDPDTGEIYLTQEAEQMIDRAVSRHIGLLTPDELKELRLSRGKTQVEMSQMFGFGDKTWARWEAGLERQSQSKNAFIRMLSLGIITEIHLRGLWDAAAMTEEVYMATSGKLQTPAAVQKQKAASIPVLEGAWISTLAPPGEALLACAARRATPSKHNPFIFCFQL